MKLPKLQISSLVPVRLKRTQVYVFGSRIWRLLRTGVLHTRYLAQNLCRCAPRLDGGGGPVVSLTTFPARISGVYATIESMAAGSLRPSEVVLWLSADELRGMALPAPLRRLQRRGLRIEVVEENYRSANKLVHALRRYPERAIVVADDDVYYPKHWLMGLCAVAATARDAIVAHNCNYLHRRPNGRLCTYREAIDEETDRRVPSYGLLGLGVGGVLYPPGSVAGIVHDRALFYELCMTNDDLWFKAASLLQGTKTRAVQARNAPALLTRFGSQRVALADVNWQGEFDRSLLRVFEHFDLMTLLDFGGEEERDS
jgi:hypothetical protein